MTEDQITQAEREQHDVMVSTLVFNVKNVLNALSNMMPFHNGDVMSACIHILVDTGMRAVVDGSITREELAKQLCSAFSKTVMEHDGVLDRKEEDEVAPTHETSETAQ